MESNERSRLSFYPDKENGTHTVNSSSLKLVEVVLVHGYPGSGKGTQCTLLEEYFGFNHLSVGDLLRKEMETNSQLDKKIKSYVEDGKILPVEDTLEILKKAMQESEVKHFLIDGYPRDKANLDGWIKFTTELDITVKCVLLLNCDKKICKNRLLENEEVSNRIDYNERTVKERFKAYEDLMGPIHEFYKDIRKEIDGQGEKGSDTPEQVFERVLQVVEEEGPQWFPSRGAVKKKVKTITEESLTPRNYYSRNAEVESDNHMSSSEQGTHKMNSSSLEGSEVVLVHGYPGSGKGTQCALLKENFGFNHLSVGDLLRKQMKTNSKLGKKIRSYVLEGKILPMEDTLEVLEKAMKKSEEKHFLLDGYPRDKANLEGWIKFTKGLKITVKCVLRLNCDKKICKKRILESEEVSNRIDYNEKAVKERFKAYENLMDPIHKFYKDIRKEIDGQGVKGNDNPQEVFKRVLHAVQEVGFRLPPPPVPHVSVEEKDEKIEKKGSREEYCIARKVGVESDKGISSLEQATLSKPSPSSLKGCEVVLVHGYPAAGKGTQCGLLAERFDFTHISVGELMRQEMKRESVASAVIKYYVLEGKIVPAKFTCQILKKVMEESEVKRFLIDGYPRDERNLKAWIKFVKDNDIKVRFVLLLKCDKVTCRRRLFNAGYQRGSGRADDNPATLEKRFEAYEDLMGPVHEYYKRIRREVDGEGERKSDTPEEVFERVKEVFQREGFEVSSPPEEESLEETKTISRTNKTEPDSEENPFKRTFKK